MTFFLLWIMTRLKENGWPKTRGLLKRSKVVTEEAFVSATQDAIRIGITIGGSLPEVARAIAITCVELFDEPITRKAVDEWIDKSATMGDEKMTALSDILPKWLRFCSMTVASSSGDVEHFRWVGDAHEEYVVEDGHISKIQRESVALAMIAMCWAYKHPNEAEDLFNNPDAIKELAEEFTTPEMAVIPDELQELVGRQATYSAWLQMAEELVSRYSKEVGFPNYEDLA